MYDEESLRLRKRQDGEVKDRTTIQYKDISLKMAFNLDKSRKWKAVAIERRISMSSLPDDFGAMLASPVSNHHSSLQTQHFLSTPSLTPYTSMPLSNEDLSSYNRNQSIRRRKNKPFGNHVDNSMNHSKSLYRTYIIPDNISISA